MTARAAHAAWLGTRTVLLAGPLAGTQGATPAVAVQLGDRRVALDVEAFSYGEPGRPGLLVVGHLRRPSAAATRPRSRSARATRRS
jgi:hypothetical protein